MEPAPYEVFITILPKEEAYVFGGTKEKPSSSKATYQLLEPNGIVIIFPDGTMDKGVYTDNTIYLTEADDLTITLTKTHNIFPNIKKASSIEEFYSNWVFAWMQMEDEPYILSQEILELFGNDYATDFEMIIDSNGISFANDETGTLMHIVLSDGALIVPEDSSILPIVLLDTGELRVQMADGAMYFTRK